MGKALYRTHRPKKLSEVVGQEHVTETLSQALKTGRISHAYLFTGPRGVGKTSVARILAHEINGLPYEDDSPHLDIIEIDAASNRRIDEMRELRDKVYVAPASAKYKVYIIDEVHMLTREAFNALLKTLEEPPAHVVFILATTDAHKLPETVISRTQRFSFKPVDKAKVVAQLRAIAKQEHITISDEALALLAEHGEGSFRDSISLLDQAGNHGGSVELADVLRLLGLAPAEAIEDLLTATLEGADSARLAQTLNGLYEQGYQADSIAKQLGAMLRSRVLGGTVPSEPAFQLLGHLLEVPAAHDPERFLDITLLRSQPAVSARAVPEPARKTTKPAPSDAGQAAPPPAAAAEPDPPKKPQPESSAQPAATKPLDPAIWPDVLQALKRRHNTLYGVVRMAQPDFSTAGTLKLAFAFAFHQKRLQEDANRQKLAGVIEELTGASVIIECIVDKQAEPPAVTVSAGEEAAADTDLTTISNIFGTAELLES